nr:MAG TPA: hypothetical protein [Caudoviricetes sp.]
MGTRYQEYLYRLISCNKEVAGAGACVRVRAYRIFSIPWYHR